MTSYPFAALDQELGRLSPVQVELIGLVYAEHFTITDAALMLAITVRDAARPMVANALELPDA